MKKFIPEKEEKLAEKKKPIAKVKSDVRSVEKKLVIETPRTEFLPHPVPEWIEANKIALHGMEFMRVPLGKFLMGSTEENKLAERDERPQHTVDIPYSYWMAQFSCD